MCSVPGKEKLPPEGGAGGCYNTCGKKIVVPRVGGREKKKIFPARTQKKRGGSENIKGGLIALQALMACGTTSHHPKKKRKGGDTLKKGKKGKSSKIIGTGS